MFRGTIFGLFDRKNTKPALNVALTTRQNQNNLKRKENSGRTHPGLDNIKCYHWFE